MKRRSSLPYKSSTEPPTARRTGKTALRRHRVLGYPVVLFHTFVSASVRGIFVSLLALALGGVEAGNSQQAKTPVPPPSADVLIVHDSLPGPLPSGLVDGNNILDLLGHFGLKGNIISLEDYKRGEISRYRYVIVLGVDDRNVVYPPDLLSDVRSTNKPVFWVFKHIDELLAEPSFMNRIGFRPARQGLLDGFTKVSYKGTSLLKGEPLLFPLEIVDGAKVQVLARAEDGKDRSEPYMARSGDFWYCADSPFAYVSEGDRYLVFCDLLHDFFKIPHQEDRKALVRLEDISVQDDADNLRDLADYLHNRNIPFQISLIPIYRDPETKEEFYLSDRPQFVRAIRHMVSRGGTVVLHGATHQYIGKSGDDYEFWDILSDRPIHSDSRALVEQKLRMALEECFKNQIYPVTWETPHYMASALDYQTIARYFNSSYERVSSLNRGETGHTFPYSSVDRYGRLIIPESLGFISAQEAETDAATLVQNSLRLKVVRDGVASFFFHPFLEREHLTRVLDGIEANGYRFRSINDYDCRVQMDDMLVQTYSDTVHLPVHGRYLHRFLMDSDGRVSSESYSEKPLDTNVTDPGVVPPDAILVMEGVSDIRPQKEPPSYGPWETFSAWIRQKLESKPAKGSNLEQPQALVVWDDALPPGDLNNQQSYVSALSVFGFRVSNRRRQDFDPGSIGKETILVVPRASAELLSPLQGGRIREFVRQGGKLILDGPSSLSESLGVSYEKRTLRIQFVNEKLYGNQTMNWKPPAEVTRFSIRDPLAVYAEDSESELPLAVLARFERGRFLYLATRLDSTTPLGYTRFPYFAHYALEGFNLKTLFQAARLELYFDPGMVQRQGVDIDRLAEVWRKTGVRAIYAAGYHFWPKWSYNYQHLVDVCHKNGILVYAWLELPHVSVKFWDDHEQWRARTATGAEGHVGWRYQMDLDIPECQEAVFGFVEELLKKYPWDGVNIAELSFDTNQGPEDPKSYLPMGDSTREAFRALGGFDPKRLFSPQDPYYWKHNPEALKKFETYRSQRVLAWHRSLLERLSPLARERDMEIIVTMLDSLHSSSVTRDTGIDSHQIISLMDQFPFTLQVEDPAHLWADSPDRYKRFTDTYLGLVRDRRRLMFDMNAVPDRDISKSHSPTPTLVGTELAHSLHYASQASGRAAIYSESTVPFEDLQMLARILASGATVERRWNSWVTESSGFVQLAAPGPWQSFRVDGKMWPGWGENEILIPGGRHQISPEESQFRIVDRSILDLRMLRFVGSLDSLTPTSRGLEFTYDSNSRSMALFNRQPFEVRVDGNLYGEVPIPYYAHWSLRLPRGRHRVEVVADSAAFVILDTASFYSSTLIAIFGAVATGLMVLLYLAILARRTLARAVRGKPSPSPSLRP